MHGNAAKAWLIALCFAAYISFLLGMSLGWKIALDRAEVSSIEMACKPPAAFFANCYRREGPPE